MKKGFILIDILIAGLILTSAIAATMYLFRVGFRNLERANISNVLSSKLPQSINLLKAVNLKKKSGTKEIGNGVTLTWKAELINKTRPLLETPAGKLPSPYELRLYKVNFRLNYKSITREYEIGIFKFKRLVPPSEFFH